MNVGLIEFGTSDNNKNDLDVIETLFETAKEADSLGFSRLWLTEHYESSTAWSNSEILLSIIAGITEKICVGSAGILLALNSPFRIANNFKMLSTLFDKRIDLGIAKGTTSINFIADELLNGVNHKLLQHDHYYRVEKLLKYIRSDYINIDEKLILNCPNSGKAPNVWLLGSSDETCNFVIKENLRLGFSLIHTKESEYKMVKNKFKCFINNFKETNRISPQTNLTVGVLYADKKSERDNLLNSRKNNFTININGDLKQCIDSIKRIADDFFLDEIVLNIETKSIDDKLSLISEISKQFSLNKTN